MTMTVKAQGLPRHVCGLPGIWRRRRLGLLVGAVVACTECGTHWKWADHPMFGPEWVRVVTPSRTDSDSDASPLTTSAQTVPSADTAELVTPPRTDRQPADRPISQNRSEGP